MTNDKKQSAKSPQPTSTTPISENDELDMDEKAYLEEEFGELPPGPIELLETEIADLKDRYIRLAADMENLRKRTERERLDIKKYAVSEFARDILPLSDNFKRAIDAVPSEAADNDETLNGFLEGVKMNERELQRVLERHGVSQINSKGEKFDPNMHQAVQQIEDATLPNNTVCEVFQVGYIIADRVLRPAVVAVAKGGAKDAPAAAKPTLTLPETGEPDTGATDTPKDTVGSTVDKNA